MLSNQKQNARNPITLKIIQYLQKKKQDLFNLKQIR